MAGVKWWLAVVPPGWPTHTSPMTRHSAGPPISPDPPMTPDQHFLWPVGPTAASGGRAGNGSAASNTTDLEDGINDCPQEQFKLSENDHNQDFFSELTGS